MIPPHSQPHQASGSGEGYYIKVASWCNVSQDGKTDVGVTIEVQPSDLSVPKLTVAMPPADALNLANLMQRCALWAENDKQYIEIMLAIGVPADKIQQFTKIVSMRRMAQIGQG